MTKERKKEKRNAAKMKPTALLVVIKKLND